MRPIIPTRFVLFLCVLLAQSSSFSSDVPSQRLEQESSHFKVVYWESHEFLIPHIINSAERTLAVLMEIFKYTPSEKIIIFTNDYDDFGAAGTTSVPYNFIRLGISPLELDYENIPFNERLQWLISHELVHIIIGDCVSKPESLARTFFSKVPPEQDNPLSVFYSILTNFDRYSPDWHQESIAMFIETWLNGGFGRLQGSFDEMFFRSIVYEGKSLALRKELETTVAPNSFLLQMQFYLYGARFGAFLSCEFGAERFIDWYRKSKTWGFDRYDKKFKEIFGITLDEAWRIFIQTEKLFQLQNIERLSQSAKTYSRSLSTTALGWVTRPMLNSTGDIIYFGSHAPHELANVKALRLLTRRLENIATLPTPRLVQVAATAIDPDAGLVFYTTNNNLFHRDLWVFDPHTKIKRKLFENIRVGDLTTCAAKRELWGIHHTQGQVVIVYSEFPYLEFKTTAKLPFGITLQHLSVSPSGKWLAGTMHSSDGSQRIIIINADSLKSEREFEYVSVSDQGNPEHPSWSQDNQRLYWNAYVNGVSNIYRFDLDSKSVHAISHTIRGFFHPLKLKSDSLFVFEFTSEGFIPTIIPDKDASYLPAITYYGNTLFEKEKDLQNWQVAYDNDDPPTVYDTSTYRGLKEIKIQSLIPVISGFQDQLVAGYYGHLGDPLLTHDIRFEFGISPRPVSDYMPRYHLNFHYEYKKYLGMAIQHNSSSFYDLFNSRKKSSPYSRISVNYLKYWMYDLPHKIEQRNELSAYLGVEEINDNTTPVEYPDFLIFESTLESTDLRRSIGSVDYEDGLKWWVTLATAHINPQNFIHLGNLHFAIERYSTVLFPHNVFVFQIAAGTSYTNGGMPVGKYYFGGFANRLLENEPVQQYRKVLRYPGLPIYAEPAENFIKIGIEEKLPPLRFKNIFWGSHFLSHADASIFSQGLVTGLTFDRAWINTGMQINFNFRHWFNLESTLSIGCAKAWRHNEDSFEWFISFKPLKN